MVGIIRADGEPMEFDSTWQWVTWAILVPLFFFCFSIVEKIAKRRYPLPIGDSDKRKLFESFWFMVLLITFHVIWGFWLEWIYN